MHNSFRANPEVFVKPLLGEIANIDSFSIQQVVVQLRSKTCILYAAPFWMQTVIRNFDVFPYLKTLYKGQKNKFNLVCSDLSGFPVASMDRFEGN